MNQIYADYAATNGQLPESVMDAVVSAMRHPGNAGRGSHDASLSAARLIFQARETAAEFFEAEGPAQIVFTSGVTQSLNTVIFGLLSPGDHVITSCAEHNSVLRPLYEMEKRGVRLSIGNPCLEGEGGIRAAVTDQTKAVILTHGSNVTGDVYKIREIGEFCRSRQILFVVDAAQTAGKIPISMKRDCIDFLCFTGHKGLMGPQGTGGICIRKGCSIRPLLVGGSGILSLSKEHPKELPAALEAGTLNAPGIAGLAAGMTFVRQEGLEHIQRKEWSLAKQFQEGIQNVPGITVYSGRKNPGIFDRTAIVSFNIGDCDAALVSDELSERFGIETRPGIHCAPLIHQRFHTERQGMVRVSFGYFSTEEEVLTCIRAVRVLAEEEQKETEA